MKAAASGVCWMHCLWLTLHFFTPSVHPFPGYCTSRKSQGRYKFHLADLVTITEPLKKLWFKNTNCWDGSLHIIGYLKHVISSMLRSEHVTKVWPRRCKREFAPSCNKCSYEEKLLFFFQTFHASLQIDITYKYNNLWTSCNMENNGRVKRWRVPQWPCYVTDHQTLKLSCPDNTLLSYFGFWDSVIFSSQNVTHLSPGNTKTTFS